MWLNRHEPADGTGAVFIVFDQTIARSDCRQRTVNIHIDGSLVLVNKTAMIRLTVKWGNLARRSVLANLHQMKWRAHEKSVCRLGLDHCHLRGNWRCGSAVAPEATQNAPPSGDNAPALSVASAQPVPVVAIPLQNGNVLEFYDMSAGVLVSEVGL